MKKSTLHTLSHAEQEQIQVMCSTQTYDKVVAHIATPRLQGGLGLKTSRAALCRFVTNYNSAPEQAAALGQLAKAVLLRSHPAGQDALAAVITILQQDILYRLSIHCSMDSVLPMLRLLHRLHLDLFKLDKRQALHAPALQKELEQMEATNKELGETDCEILDEPFGPDPYPPSAREDLRPYLDPVEGSLWPDQAPRVPYSEDESTMPVPDNTHDPEGRVPSPGVSEPTELEETPSPSSPSSPFGPLCPLSPYSSSPEPEYSTPDSTNSTKNPCNSTYSSNSTPSEIAATEELSPSDPLYPFRPRRSSASSHLSTAASTSEVQP